MTLLFYKQSEQEIGIYKASHLVSLWLSVIFCYTLPCRHARQMVDIIFRPAGTITAGQAEVARNDKFA